VLPPLSPNRSAREMSWRRPEEKALRLLRESRCRVNVEDLCEVSEELGFDRERCPGALRRLRRARTLGDRKSLPTGLPFLSLGSARGVPTGLPQDRHEATRTVVSTRQSESLRRLSSCPSASYGPDRPGWPLLSWRGGARHLFVAPQPSLTGVDGLGSLTSIGLDCSLTYLNSAAKQTAKRAVSSAAMIC
jgi:hypothetical protein